MITVTKDFKKDLKTADNVNFRFVSNTLTITFIIQEKKNKSGWIKPEIRKEYTANAREYMTINDAWFNITYKNHSNIQVLDYVLKVDDVLYFDNMDNSQQNLEEVGLHHDELICRIYRKEKCIIERLVLESSICADNSARAIRIGA